jgi:formylglycine-generating enzyme required for sulfatase activity
MMKILDKVILFLGAIFLILLESCCPLELRIVLKPEMVNVKGGTIVGANYAGAPPNGNFPLGRTVVLSDFAIGKYEVTQEEYESVMKDQVVRVKGIEDVTFSLDSNPSSCQKDSTTYVLFEGECQERRPVESITWYDAVWYCNALSEKLRLKPVYKITVTEVTSINLSSHITAAEVELIPDANGYRLPTECEAEYAARGGDVNAPDWSYAFSGADTEPGKIRQTVNKGCDEVAWYRYNNRTGVSSTTENREDDTYFSYKGTHEVGKRKPNRLGIYDMSGNVSEYCYGKINWDVFPKYTGEPEVNPVREDEGGNRSASIGGSWGSAASGCFAYNFPTNPASLYSDTMGFRVARSLK